MRLFRGAGKKTTAERAKRLFDQAHAHYVSGSIAESVRCLEALLHLTPNDLDVRLMLANEYSVLGRTNDAIREVSECLRRDPNNNEALGMLGLFYCQQGDLRRGINYLERSAKGLSDSVSLSATLGTLGAAYHMLGDHQWAMKYWQASIQHNLQNFESHFCLGIVYIEEGHLDQALHEFQIAESLAPDKSTMVYRAPEMMIEAIRTLTRKSNGSSEVIPSDGMQQFMELIVPLAWGLIVEK